MKLNKYLLATVACLSALSLTGCGKKTVKRNENELLICVYDGGYGTDWIDALAKDYEAKTGITVTWTADTSLLDRIEDQLNNVSDYDIYMSQDINWQNFAAQGLLANLDDLYDQDVEGVKFKDRLVPAAEEMSKAEDENGDMHYYKVCYTQGAGGIVYNIDMFEEHGWQVPTTYEELKTLCQTIINAHVDADDRKTVVPFAWSGSDRQYYWDYLVFEWWAQLAGMETINKFRAFKGPDDGTYAKGYEVYNPTGVYKDFWTAYDMWYDLIAMNKSNSINGAYGTNLLTAQSAFANKEAAMIPYGQWAKHEIENAVNRKLDFDVAMMPTPKAKADSAQYNYMVGFGDSMIIPENTPNKKLAKDFIAYMATKEACKTFVEKAEGPFLAFDYSGVDLSSIEANDTYVKSIHDKLSNSTCFHLASQNPMTYFNVNKLMPWIENNYYYASACSKPEDNTSATLSTKIYNTAKNSWPVWMRNAGVN